MSTGPWIKALRGTPHEEVARVLAGLEKSAERPCTDDELAALEEHFEGMARELGWYRVEQLRREAAAAFNAWLAAKEMPLYAAIAAEDIKETAADAHAWIVYVDVPVYRNLPSIGESASRVEALKHFILCARGEL
ncbi:MAG: hypothetical protein ABJE95_27540 [Byssovorax sp.]